MIKAKELEQAIRGEGCLGKAADDEPVFILRAKDQLASVVVRRWADLAEAASHPDSPTRKKAADARQLAKDMDNWRAEHGGGKVPD